MRREFFVSAEDFRGLEQDMEKSAKSPNLATIDDNGDRSVRGVWRPRGGLSDTGTTDGTDAINAIGTGRVISGNVVMLATSTGKLEGYAVPVPQWE